ncbi:MAG TPA: Na+/H+ antiporter subunit D [Jiangellaceae bacterium]|nr:Na+/H+ antiporter subunit D [Jiangellaceae bacterium]
MNALLVPLPVMLPLFGAGLALALGRYPRVQQLISVAVLTIVVGVALTLVIRADLEGAQAVWVGGWENLGIALVADRLSALMLLVSSVVSLGVLVYSLGQGLTDGQEDTPLSIYHPTYLVLHAGVANAFLAGDLFNLFVGFEILLTASYVLLTLGGTSERVRAGSIYVVVGVVSSLIFLAAVAVVYGATGTVNMAQLAHRIDALSPGVSLTLQLMLLVAFGIKAAVFPLSAWLPDSYPTAPAPVTAVFAGLLTKVGIYAIIRTQTILFDRALTDVLLWAAILTMLVGILGAVAQSDVKRILSFTLVSHIGYMIFGVGLYTEAGISGAILYVVHHITIQSTLFLVTGLIERRGGSTSLTRLGGLARLAPALAVLFFVPAMNLSGIPPFSGFVAKVGLLSAGVRYDTGLAYALVGAGVLTSLLTLYAMAKAWNRAFWREPTEALGRVEELRSNDQPAPLLARTGSGARGSNMSDSDSDVPLHPDVEEDALHLGERPAALPASMVGPTAAMVAVSVLITVLAGPLVGYTDRAAADLLDRGPYIGAVLGEDPP